MQSALAFCMLPDMVSRVWFGDQSSLISSVWYQLVSDLVCTLESRRLVRSMNRFRMSALVWCKISYLVICLVWYAILSDLLMCYIQKDVGHPYGVGRSTTTHSLYYIFLFKLCCILKNIANIVFHLLLMRKLAIFILF